MKERVTLLLEPVARCYARTFQEGLVQHPEIANKLVRKQGRKVYWESKEVFVETNYERNKDFLALETEIVNAIKGSNEFMSFITNVVS